MINIQEAVTVTHISARMRQRVAHVGQNMPVMGIIRKTVNVICVKGAKPEKLLNVLSAKDDTHKLEMMTI
jgi:hypothetical protein